jgi:hypothetical protein
MAITVRQATVSDIPHLAFFLLEATGGIIEAIYHGVIPERPTQQIVEHLFSLPGSISSLANCWVAEHEGAVVGGLNAFPYDAFDQEPVNPLFLEERRPLARLPINSLLQAVIISGPLPCTLPLGVQAWAVL